MMAPPSQQTLFRLNAITKRYGRVAALYKLSLQVFADECVALFGPNGAGKTTLLKVMASLISPDAGTIDFPSDRPERGRVGYVSHQSLLYNELTGMENLLFYGRLYGLSEARERAVEMLDRMGLVSAAPLRVGGYSRGMKQRLSLGRALLHDPPLLLLDEPYTGLDQHGSRLLTRTLEKLKARNRTIFLVTHNTREGLDVCDRVLIQSRGRIVLETSRRKVDEENFEKLYFEAVDDSVEDAGKTR